MTTKLKGLTVAFALDIREDDAESIINAIKMLKGVLDVAPLATSTDDFIIETRVRQELTEKLLEIAYPKSVKNN